jgi:hypothetical protein
MASTTSPISCRQPLVPALAAGAVAALTVAVLSLGTVRVDRHSPPQSLEWQNGWPLVFLSRHVGRDPNKGDPEACVATKDVISLSPGRAVADCLLPPCVFIAVYFIARRRRSANRWSQFGLRGLLATVLGVAALLGWGVHVKRRQERAVKQLEREKIHFGFQVDQGLPHCVRRWLPGGRLRPFDRITDVTCGGPLCVDEQMAALADLPDVAMVTIMSNEVRDGGLRHLAGLSELIYLDAWGPSHIGDDGVAYLSGLHELKTLNLGSSEVTDRGVAHLAHLTELEKLDLGRCKISDAGLTHLASLHELRTLELIEDNISDAGVASLTRLTSLQRLGLCGTRISEASVPRLMEFKKLKWLDLRRTSLTPQAIARLKQALPACKVFWP